MMMQLIALTLCNLSWAKAGQGQMVKDAAVPLLCTLVKHIATQHQAQEDTSQVTAYTTAMVVDCSLAFCNIAFQSELRQQCLQEGALEALIILTGIATGDTDGNWRCAAALRFLALLPENRPLMVEGRVVGTLVELASQPQAKMETQRECCAAVCSLSKCISAEVRQAIVQQGATPLLIRLSKSSNAATVKSCSVALSNLS